MKQTLTIKKGDQQAIDELWDLLDRGWSVTSAVFLHTPQKFKIRLTTEPWPEIKIPCGGCGLRWLPYLLKFHPHSRECFCETCS